MSERFVFICGAPRSGTTLLANLLDGHSGIAQFPNGETHILQHWFRLPDDAARRRFFLRDYLNTEEVLLLTDETAAAQYDAQVRHVHGNEDVFSPRRVDRGRFVAEYLTRLRAGEMSLGAVYAALLRASLRAGGTTPGGRLWVERRPLDNEIAALALAQALPEARFIHVVRDPRTRYLSAKMRRIRRLRGLPLFAPEVHGIDFASAHAAVTMTSLTLARLNREVMPERYLVVRHEDLTADTEAVMRRVAEFLNLGFEATLLAPTSGGHAATPMSSVSRSLADTSVVHDLDPQRRRQYASATSATERRIVEFFTWQIAAELGYAVPRRDRLRRRDLLAPLRHENPLSYLRNRRRMFERIRGPGIYVLPTLFQELVDRFHAGLPVHD